jgi:hypothetical protein
LAGSGPSPGAGFVAVRTPSGAEDVTIADWNVRFFEAGELAGSDARAAEYTIMLKNTTGAAFHDVDMRLMPPNQRWSSGVWIPTLDARTLGPAETAAFVRLVHEDPMGARATDIAVLARDDAATEAAAEPEATSSALMLPAFEDARDPLEPIELTPAEFEAVLADPAAWIRVEIEWSDSYAHFGVELALPDRRRARTP